MPYRRGYENYFPLPGTRAHPYYPGDKIDPEFPEAEADELEARRRDRAALRSQQYRHSRLEEKRAKIREHARTAPQRESTYWPVSTDELEARRRDRAVLRSQQYRHSRLEEQRAMMREHARTAPQREPAYWPVTTNIPLTRKPRIRDRIRFWWEERKLRRKVQ